MIRVLHIARIINRHDFIDSVLSRLDRAAFQVVALTSQPANRLGEYSPEESYPIRIAGYPFTRRYAIRMLRTLLAEIAALRPHVIHAHHYTECLVASIAAKIARVPAYVVGREYSDQIYALASGWKRRLYLTGEGIVNRVATRIVVPSAEVAELLSSRQGVPREKIVVIPYGFQLANYRTSTPDAPQRLRAKYGLQDRYVIVTSSRLNREKGLQYLLQAVAMLQADYPRLRIVMLGSGPDEACLRREAADLGLEKTTHFLGWRNDVLDWIAAADVVVQPSLSESFCQTLVEALAFRKPVIMTPVGAAPAVLGNNQRGRLVPSRDSRAIAGAIEDLVRDPELGKRLGEQGKQYVCDNLDAHLAARRFQELYALLADDAASRAAGDPS